MLEPEGTAEVDVETPPFIDEDEETETEDDTSTETDNEEEDEGDEDPLAKLSEDDLKSHPKVVAQLKSLEARLNESFRQRERNAKLAQEEETLKRRHSEEVEYLKGNSGTTWANNTATSIARVVTDKFKEWSEDESDNSPFTIKPAELVQVIGDEVNKVGSSIVANSLLQMADVFDKFRKDEHGSYKPEEEDIKVRERAILDKNIPLIYSINAAMLLKADRAKYEADVRKDERERVLAELKKQEDTGKIETKAKQLAAKPKATTVGAPVGSGDLKFTLEQIDSMPTEEWLSFAKADRDKWLSAARNDFDRRNKVRSLTRTG